MHTMWKGSVSFGLVSVPVRMFAATESKDVKFRYLHAACKTPIQVTRACPTCNRAVEWDEIVRGFEYQPNQFVIIDEEDLKKIQKKRSSTIDIVDFVSLSEIDPVYFDKTYYLAPETSGVKAYHLLNSAMRESGKIAVARTVLRNAETLACLRVHQNVLVMETLFWPDEVRPVQELPNLHLESTSTPRELEMAVTLVHQLATTFSPENYRDERRRDVLALIEEKAASQPVITAEAPQAQDNIVDLMAALQQSIRQTKPAQKATTKRSS